MPFTLSHPAAVLPLLRRPFSAAALVAGALAPDLPYFARSTPVPVSAQSWYEPYMNATTSHTLLGALTVSLPYAVALWGLFLLARRPVGSLLPAPAAGTRPPEPDGASVLLRRAGWALLSLVIGIATHLVWDSFTHSDGYVVMHVPFLSTPLAGDLTWARALQHVSTIGGLVIIAVYLWRRRSRLRPPTLPDGGALCGSSGSPPASPSSARSPAPSSGGAAVQGSPGGTWSRACSPTSRPAPAPHSSPHCSSTSCAGGPSGVSARSAGRADALLQAEPSRAVPAPGLPQPGIAAARGQELRMRTFLGDAAMLHHDHAVRCGGLVQPVRDDEGLTSAPSCSGGTITSGRTSSRRS